ncbi:MAG: CHAT domain-containing protein [Cyanothece sp. SIO2G6]|nr:CHAT domain-containing protein [Cyanothece sp. SIO2G6]
MGRRFKYGLMAIATALFCLVATPAIAHFNSDHVHSGHVSSEQVSSGHVHSEQVHSEQVHSEQVSSVSGDTPESALLESTPMESALTRPRLTTAQGLVDQGRDRYEAGQFQAAVRLLQQAVDTHAANGQFLQQAIALSNLSLAYQALGDWAGATIAIETGLDILNGLPGDTVGQAAVSAQALTIQGRLQFAQGQFQSAFDTWQQVTDYHQQQGDDAKRLESQLNQIQALQALGFYNQAIDQLTAIHVDLAAQPDSPTKVVVLQHLGNALRVAGYLGNPALNAAPFNAAPFNAALSNTAPAASSSATAIPMDNGVPILPQDLGATSVLTQALALAQKLGLRDAIASTSMHLGDIAYNQAINLPEINPRLMLSQGDWFEQATAFYQEAIAQSTQPAVQTNARLRQLDIAIATAITTADWASAQRLRTQIQLQLQSVSPTRTTIHQRVQLAQTLIQVKQTMAASAFSDPAIQPIQWSDIATLLATANQQAEALGDDRVRAYVLGTLGHVYEQANRQAEAVRLTQQALRFALATNASDITYQWYWQLARLRQQEIQQLGNNDAAIAAQKREEAITAYQQAIAAIKQLRVDLAAVDQAAQFSFRSNIEPIHRGLVSLLLDSNLPPDTDVSGEDLELARQTIEDLQLAELDNFFRESCLNAQDIEIDDLDQQAAVIYPIVLGDRLEVILSLPETSASEVATKSSSTADKRTLRHFSQADLPESQVDEQVAGIQQLMRARLSASGERQLKFRLAEVYDWLIRPFADELQASGTETLVFVLDGSLRNIPMAALFDGDRYLIEQYSVALTPGLQLTESTPPDVQELDVLLGGLSESREDFLALPNVEDELARITDTVASSRKLLDEQFTNRAVQRQFNASSSPVVHLATHGNFGNQYDDTYLLTWDTRLNIRELSTLLQSSELSRQRPIELLVLSACQTAAGDKRAALGLAGMAVRSGARSTIATLWTVYDESTALAMQNFYDVWVTKGVTKAEALRQAQQTLIATPEFNLPYYWAPFILLGNWL